MDYTIKNHYETTFKDVTYTQMFVQMKARQQARENSALHSSSDDFSLFHEETRRIPFNAQWAKERDYDSDELFFSQDDDEDEELEPPFVDSDSLSDQKMLPQRKIAMEPIYPSVTKRKCMFQVF